MFKTDEERELFRRVLNSEKNSEEQILLLMELETLMGSDRYNAFMAMGRAMFAPKN